MAASQGAEARLHVTIFNYGGIVKCPCFHIMVVSRHKPEKKTLITIKREL